MSPVVDTREKMKFVDALCPFTINRETEELQYVMGLRPNSAFEMEYEVVENNTQILTDDFVELAKLNITLKFCKHHEHRFHSSNTPQQKIELMFPQITWVYGYSFQDIVMRLQPHCSDRMILEMIRELDVTKPTHVHSIRKDKTMN